MSIATTVEAVIYTFCFAHHGQYSSYHHLSDYLRDQRVVDCTLPLPEWLPARVGDRLTYEWRKFSEYRLWRSVRGRRPTCIHYLYPENTLFRGWRWVAEHHLILTCHQPESFLKRMQAGGRVNFFRGLQLARAVIVLDPQLAAAYRELAPRAEVVTIPHGVDVDFFEPSSRPPNRGRVLTVGNWLRDYDCWAAVVKTVRARHPDIEFCVVANPATLQLARQCLGGSLEGVTLLSSLSDVELREAYRQAALLFLPLQEASANNALLESMAMGLPAVATDLPAVRWYLGDVAGALVENHDITACAAQIVQLVDNPSRRIAVGQRARQRAIREFSWAVIAQRHRELYAKFSS